MLRYRCICESKTRRHPQCKAETHTGPGPWEKDLGGGYRAVDYDCVTLNGLWLGERLKEGTPNRYAVMGPDNRALLGEEGGVYRYSTVGEAAADVKVLQGINERQASEPVVVKVDKALGLIAQTAVDELNRLDVHAGDMEKLAIIVNAIRKGREPL